MFAKSASFVTSFGVNYSVAPLKNGSHKKFAVFAKFASSLTSCRVDYSMTPLKGGGEMFTLTLKGDDGTDARYLTPVLLESFSSELHQVKKNATDRSVLITTAEGKNFCQGFDPSVKKKDGYPLEVIDPLRQLVEDLIRLPMPTIAAINGSTRSAGLILAMSHDYLTFTTKKDTLFCMSELDYEMTLPDFFTAMLRSKVTPSALASLALTGETAEAFNSEDAKKIFGLAVTQPSDAAKQLAEKLAKEKKGFLSKLTNLWPFHKKKDGKVYSDQLVAANDLAEKLSQYNWDVKLHPEIRKALYPDLFNVLEKGCTPFSP